MFRVVLLSRLSLSRKQRIATNQAMASVLRIRGTRLPLMTDSFRPRGSLRSFLPSKNFQSGLAIPLNPQGAGRPQITIASAWAKPWQTCFEVRVRPVHGW